jgi:hypothetical protein
MISSGLDTWQGLGPGAGIMAHSLGLYLREVHGLGGARGSCPLARLLHRAPPTPLLSPITRARARGSRLDALEACDADALVRVLSQLQGAAGLDQEVEDDLARRGAAWAERACRGAVGPAAARATQRATARAPESALERAGKLVRPSCPREESDEAAGFEQWSPAGCPDGEPLHT